MKPSDDSGKIYLCIKRSMRGTGKKPRQQADRAEFEAKTMRGRGQTVAKEQ